ncbi:DUF4177 domain-containing protein [Alkalicoccobacillus porphyridii]|uniref:DUF4177 domain-containing protein n=1 Tax=Alkalicoccobacillus porphyridii TaxID=2597270 RepID=A0A554A2E0_9BACI|nr:DUF4177 domain-containing protein [Alkalicoccobacillus porphyridii]TSB47816.1 DUF4177 domain-containing protein [Alkalicoccobacillus porphyridii]
MKYKAVLLPVAMTKKRTALIEETLNELASDGWELVSMQAQQSLGGTDGNLAVFKRNHGDTD